MEQEKRTPMEKKVYLSWYLAFYGQMLTENQQEIARLYFEEDYSLAEIAQQFSVSRQSIHDTVNRVEKTLKDFEEKLGLARRFRQQEEGLRKCSEVLEKVVSDEATKSHLIEARSIINTLLDQEEM